MLLTFAQEKLFEVLQHPEVGCEIVHGGCFFILAFIVVAQFLWQVYLQLRNGHGLTALLAIAGLGGVIWMASLAAGCDYGLLFGISLFEVGHIALVVSHSPSRSL
jgi:hypothetical protein